MAKPDYIMDASVGVENIASLIESMPHGATAEIITRDAVLSLSKFTPSSICSGRKTGLVSLYVWVPTSRFPEEAQYIIDAAKDLARDSWIDWLDYEVGEGRVRWIFFYPRS